MCSYAKERTIWRELHVAAGKEAEAHVVPIGSCVRRLVHSKIGCGVPGVERVDRVDRHTFDMARSGLPGSGNSVGYIGPRFTGIRRHHYLLRYSSKAHHDEAGILI